MPVPSSSICLLIHLMGRNHEAGVRIGYYCGRALGVLWGILSSWGGAWRSVIINQQRKFGIIKLSRDVRRFNSSLGSYCFAEHPQNKMHWLPYKYPSRKTGNHNPMLDKGRLHTWQVDEFWNAPTLIAFKEFAIAIMYDRWSLRFCEWYARIWTCTLCFVLFTSGSMDCRRRTCKSFRSMPDILEGEFCGDGLIATHRWPRSLQLPTLYWWSKRHLITDWNFWFVCGC